MKMTFGDNLKYYGNKNATIQIMCSRWIRNISISLVNFYSHLSINFVIDPVSLAERLDDPLTIFHIQLGQWIKQIHQDQSDYIHLTTNKTQI